MKYELKIHTTITYNCHYHVVFCPKYRRKVLVKGVDERLKAILIETIEKWGQELVELEVMTDHVHLLVGCETKFGINRLLKYLKGTSSRFLRHEFLQYKWCFLSLCTYPLFIHIPVA